MTTLWRRLAWTLVLVTLGSLGLARDAAAYWGVTTLDYGGQLTGYARAEKDAWDEDSYLECTHWEVHWYYGWMCFEAVETFYSVGLEHELWTPTGALQASGAGSSSWTLQLDLVPHTPTVYGTWTHHGEYFTVRDEYLYVWNEYTWDYDVTYEGQSWDLFGGHSPQVNVPPPSPPPVQVHYVHTDALGSVRLMTDAAGQPVTECNYLPFGQDWQSTGNVFAGCRFAQTERSPATGAGSWQDLNYAGARYYHGQTWRFTSVDPGHVGASLDDPQSWNGYAYARNNPLRFVDPTGLAYEICIQGQSSCTVVSDQEWAVAADDPGPGNMVLRDKTRPEWELPSGFIFGGGVWVGVYRQLYIDQPTTWDAVVAGVQRAAPVVEPEFIAGWYGASAAAGITAWGLGAFSGGSLTTLGLGEVAVGANLEFLFGAAKAAVVRGVISGRQPLSALSNAERLRAAAFYRSVAQRVGGNQAAAAARYNIARAEYLEGTRAFLSKTLPEFIRNGFR